MQRGSPTDSKLLTESTMHWMLILVTCVCIIRLCRPTGISTLNVRVCELKC
ncbi:hypothetical protein MTR67_023205 [Solanum verrucosum]|uniref:Uncharacterized protein n=1 Tax=Solanum verrucosum TaxID=315347 RepID=A0AAF0QZA3_SOLVR|nr:hypothetical protein MTR67_023205 [Solanum verrucosum]